LLPEGEYNGKTVPVMHGVVMIPTAILMGTAEILASIKAN
jgi:hypothetical protein